MFEISIQGRGFAELDALASRLKNLQPPLAETGAYLENKAKVRFASETAPDGRKWAALRPSTLASKKTTAILRESAVMAASISFRVAGNMVIVKPGVDYAIFHQIGTRAYKIRPKTKKALAFQTGNGMAFAKEVNHPGLPARPFMGFEADDPEKIARIFSDYLGG